MKLFQRAASCLLAAFLVVSSVPVTAFAAGGEGSLPTVPEEQELVYFVDCGASAFPDSVKSLMDQYPDSVQNAGTPDQPYSASGQTWGYTNSDDTVMTYSGDDAYETLRCFQSGRNGNPLQYQFDVDAGSYQVYVGLYDPWTQSNRVREASVSVTGAQAQTYVYRDHGKDYLTFSGVDIQEGPLTVTVSPLGDVKSDDHDVLISFIMVTRQKTQEPDPTPAQPAMPSGETAIWGKDGQGWKLSVTYSCTNPSAAHKGGNTKTQNMNFISGKFFQYGTEMLYDETLQTWTVDATVDAESLLQEFFGVAHPGATADPATVTLAYQEASQKWYIVTDQDKAYLTVAGSCGQNGPAAPELGKNLEVWVQLYDGEYGPVTGSQIDRQSSKYGKSITFGTPVKGEDGTWTCEMTIVGYTEDESLSGSCYGNLKLPAGYEMDPYELRFETDKAGNVVRTVTLIYNQSNEKWECPEIPLKKTSRGPGESNPKTHYGVAFKILNTADPDENAPSLPVENPVHNGGFWVSLYEDTGTGTCEVFTQVYDGTQDYVTFSAPAYGEGLLETYETVATVDPAKVLEESGLTGYELVSDQPGKNELVFDWESMTWTAQTMHPQFQQPGKTTAKRGLAFKVEKDQAPGIPTKDNCSFTVTVYKQEPKEDGTVHNQALSARQWYLMGSDEATVTFAEPVQSTDGTWTCEATVDAAAFVEKTLNSFASSHIRRDDTDPTTKTITLTYDESRGKWIAPSDGVTYGYTGNTETKNGVAFRTIQQYTVTYNPGRDLKFQIPTGEPVDGGAYDKGATVELPETAPFQTENGVFAGWKVSIQKKPGSSENYFYPVGTDMTMFGQDVELEAYWMDVKLEVASVPYDAKMNAKDYTFGKTGEFDLDGDSITLLYRATVQGNGYYPYDLQCDGAQAAYGSELKGSMSIAQTSKVVYFTKTYASGTAAPSQESVAMGNASDTVALTFHQNTSTPTPSTPTPGTPTPGTPAPATPAPTATTTTTTTQPAKQTPAPTAAPVAIPQTGDSLPIGLLGGLAGLSLIGLILLVARRKDNKNL